jgi:type VI secretion system protein ImpG
MDRRLLSHYNTELAHLRAVAAEFAHEFPKIAGRLALDRDAKEVCPDPLVERLLEGFAFLTARIQVKLDAEFPQFTQSLLETVYPHYLCPTPSAAIVQFSPELDSLETTEGFSIPRGSLLSSVSGPGHRTSCLYRTTYPVTLWPFEVTDVRYYTRELYPFQSLGSFAGKAVLQIRLSGRMKLDFQKLSLDSLVLFLRGADDLPDILYENLIRHALGVAVRAPGLASDPRRFVPADRSIRRYGFQHALLPETSRSFSGYRLLHEYFTLRQRFLFIELTDLQPIIRQTSGPAIDLIIPLKEQDLRLERGIDAKSVGLHCTPAINTFEKQLDRVFLDHGHHEFQVIADKIKPFEFEIFEIQTVTGYGGETAVPISPFYLTRHETTANRKPKQYYTVRREPRHLTLQEQRFGSTAGYAGSELFVSLVDPVSEPSERKFDQLGIRALCTNRHLPMELPIGQSATDFTLDLNAPVRSIRCIVGPTAPRPPQAQGAENWRLLSHLTLNFLTLQNAGDGTGPQALRELLRLYSSPENRGAERLIEGVVSSKVEPVIRRLEIPGPMAFGRGMRINLELDELAFQGVGIFVFGAVLAEFFARYVSLNSFVETSVQSIQRQEVMLWSAQPGRRPII